VLLSGAKVRSEQLTEHGAGAQLKYLLVGFGAPAFSKPGGAEQEFKTKWAPTLIGR